MANISLEQSLQAYRVLYTPSKLSWKKHWAEETFNSPDMLYLNEDDRKQFEKRLMECPISIMNNNKVHEGKACTLLDLINTITSISNKNIPKNKRKIVYSVSDGIRPVGEKAWSAWNGFQVIDLDIKNEEISNKLKYILFNKLRKCNWFLGVVRSSSGQGLHIYTKITVQDLDSTYKQKILYRANFRHKYSFVYLACLSVLDEIGCTKETLLKWIDLAMDKPQQGAYIGYDPHPLISTKFFEDFIYVDIDNVEDLGHPGVDWLTYPDLQDMFSRWEWFEDENKNITIEVLDSPKPQEDIHNKIHYKHFERWRLANTLVNLYGLSDGFKYLRMICSNSIKDKELQADCATAARHKKPIDSWAVSRLNNQHGFNIKVNLQDDFNESDLFASVDKIDNPLLIVESKDINNYHLNKDQYLGDIRLNLIKNLSKINLLEAGAGVGKTEMVKKLVKEDHKRILLVMPFTSTIRSKIEYDDSWEFAYGNRRVNLNCKNNGLAMTVDKFSRLNVMDIKMAGFEYIFLDESHLLFQSNYRDVMSKVIENIRNIEIPVILMSGTPSGELVFFPQARHIKITKEDTRKKEFRVKIVDSSPHLLYHICKDMARDISEGKRILFPSNTGTLYSKQIKAGVTYFLRNYYAYESDVNLKYYKKSNIGEAFMDDVNIEKTIKDTQILMCTTFLSVGVDILDKYNFSIYFADLMMPQEVEQFANRLRANDLFINLYVSKNDSEGNTRSIYKYKELNFKRNEDEIRDVLSILRICNDIIERNPVEYKYNSIVSSIIKEKKFIEYNNIQNKYYLNEIAYNVNYFELKYRDYVQQLPVLVRGMQAYGYQISIKDIGGLNEEDISVFENIKILMRSAYDETLVLNTKHVEELLDIITEDRINLYKDVLAGKYSIFKGSKWSEDLSKHKIIVKNIEVFEKVIPIVISLSKQYEISTIKDIFNFCKNSGGSFNFATLKRLRTLINILYNDKKNRLDIPIKEFMNDVYKFIEPKIRTKTELNTFLTEWSLKYARKVSTNKILIEHSTLTLKSLKNKFEVLFRCLVKMTYLKKGNSIKLEKITPMWTERRTIDQFNNEIYTYAIEEFLGFLEKDENR